MTDEIIEKLGKKDFTVNRTVDFELMIYSKNPGSVKVCNPHGYHVEDVPDIDSAEILEDTTYFYLYFDYGEGEEDLTTWDDSTRIRTSVNTAYWEIQSRSDVQKGRYWKLLPVQDFYLPSGDDTGMHEAVVHFLDVKCNGMVGVTWLHIQDAEKKTNSLEITKYPEPKIENAMVVDPGPYLIGESYQIGWSMHEPLEFRIFCDQEDVTEKVNCQGDVCNLTVQARTVSYTISAKNEIGDSDSVTIRFPLKFIKSVSIQEIQRDHVTFIWDMEEKNIAWCSLRGLKEQAVDIDPMSRGQTFSGLDITGDQRFEFMAKARDSEYVDKKVLEYHCPEILDFELLGNENALAGKDPDIRLEGRDILEGFISSAFLEENKGRPDIILRQVFSCKGGGPVYYDHHYSWKTKNVVSCQIELESGELYKGLAAEEDDWKISTTNRSGQASLTAFGEYGYQVKRSTGEQERRRLEWCSWEITKRCNMDCDICLCGGPHIPEDELTTQEALELCRQMKEMGVERVILTGGEPLVRDDWEQIARELADGGIEVQLVTNGLRIDADIARRIEAAGISRVTVSIDGTEAVHDNIRTAGSYAGCRKAILALQNTTVQVFAATTVTGDNFEDLPRLREALELMQVQNWSLQLGLPYGNFVSRKMKVLDPDQVQDLIDFCLETEIRGKITVYPGDTIGCYTKKEIFVRQQALGTEKLPVFQGCPAGISTASISSSGDILTISMCVDGFIAGNIRNQPLKEIWENDDNPAWKWRRTLRETELKGACRECRYAKLCLGGCPAVRYAMTGDILGENKLCVYRNM